jgi:Transglutaminase-like superfamily
VDRSDAGMAASRLLADRQGWCVNKAALLSAVCRARGIPARVGYADVRNHLSTERLRAVIGTNDYVWHLDGTADSIYQAHDRQGRRHMEYTRERGEYDDIPVAQIRAAFLHHYPMLVQLSGADFDRDVAAESASSSEYSP